MKKLTIRSYVAAIDLAALAAFFLVLNQRVEQCGVGVFVLATLILLAGATPVRIPALKVKVSATDPFVFAALAAYGPMPACMVAAAGVVGSTLLKDGDRKPLHFAFNMGNVVLNTGVASMVYLIAGGVPGGTLGSQIWPLVLATSVNFLLNTVLVTGAIVLDTGRGFMRTWRESGLWTAVSSYAGLTMAAGLVWALGVVGPSGLALGIPPCWLLAAFYRTHKERQEEQQRRISEVEQLNLALEDKVAERTRELREALDHIEETNRTPGHDQRATGRGQPDQERVPGQRVPRTAHAAQCDHRVLRTAAGSGPGRAERRAGRVRQGHQRERRTSAAPDQRDPGPVEDRGGQDGGPSGALRRDQAGPGGRGHGAAPGGQEEPGPEGLCFDGRRFRASWIRACSGRCW